MALVLIAEPDVDLRNGIAKDFERHGYDTHGVGTAGDALPMVDRTDVALLNIDLPDSDGLRLCRRIRARPEVVIIVYTSGVGELDHVLAFQAGADHCVPRQTGVREMVARIDAVQRRGRGSTPTEVSATAPGQQPVLLSTTVNGLELIINRTSRTITHGGEVVPMTRKELDLVSLLVEMEGQNVTRDTLMERVWSDGSGVHTRTLDTHVNSVRRKIGSRAAITCLRGIGYRFEAS